MWERPGLSVRPGLSLRSTYSREELGFAIGPSSLDLLR